MNDFKGKADELRAYPNVHPDESSDIADLLDQASELYDWLYAVWMAYLADEETHDLNGVLRNLSAFMMEREDNSKQQDRVSPSDSRGGRLT